MTWLSRVVAAVVLILFARRSAARPVEQAGPRAERARAAIARFVVKHPLVTITALAAVAIAAGASVMVSGVVPIKASSGHWTITAMLLDFAKLRSVATYSLAVTPVPLDDTALVLRGAAQYALGCAPCHGGPEGSIPPVMRAMTPPPPALASRVGRYTSAELFTIIKHGIKFTGMPAWPEQRRDDEVWAVVAFVRRMPQVSATEYRRLAYGDAAGLPQPSPPLSGSAMEPAPEIARKICTRCHGSDGAGGGAFPRIAAQQQQYLYETMRAFASGNRFSGVMSSVAAGLSDAVMRELSQHYSALPAPQTSPPVDAAMGAAGAAIATAGVPQRAIPACQECHRPAGRAMHPVYPRLAGQPAWYLASQLELLQRRHRGGTARVELMHAFVNRLRPEDIAAVSAYFASTRP